MSKRSELVANLAATLGSTKKDADAIFMEVVASVKDQLSATGESVLPGFGRLKVVQRPERSGRNPKTGETITIQAKAVVKFKEF